MGEKSIIELPDGNAHKYNYLINLKPRYKM